VQDWQQEVGEGLSGAGEDLGRQLEGLQRNLGEAADELGSSLAAANEQAAAELEQGAQKWGQLAREVAAALEPGAAPPPSQDAAAVGQAVVSSGEPSRLWACGYGGEVCCSPSPAAKRRSRWGGLACARGAEHRLRARRPWLVHPCCS
jgi:hypothetical protein